MKRTVTLTAIALVLVSSATAAIERFTPAKGSTIRITGTSTLHDWTMEGSTIKGQLDVPAAIAQSVTPDSWKSAGDSTAAATVAIPVTSIRSEHSRMDKLMAQALKAKTNPEIRYELQSATLATANGATFAVETTGKLTIAGVTRELAMKVAGEREASGRYVLTGEAPLKMSDYGIKPPTAMMGTIKTGNDVQVRFRWVVEATH